MNEVIKTLLSRRSTKCFDPARPVEPEKLDEILLAGTYAPNGMGRQSAKIVVLTKKEDIAALERMNAAVIGNPDAHPFYGAPTVCIVLAKKDAFTGVEDGSLVMGNLMTAAEALGVGACWIHRAREEFDSAEGKALLKKWGMEGEYIGVGHCVLGYRVGEPREALPRKTDYIVKV